MWRSWWEGRYGRRLLGEIAILAVLLTLYRLGRLLARDEVVEAFANAVDVRALEDRLGIDNEAWLQGLLFRSDAIGVLRFLNRYYVTAHFSAAVAALVLLYARTPALYRHVRAVFVAVTFVGLAIHIAFPLAPPRMFKGFVDTLRVYGPSIYEREDVASFANQYAAMPSLHVGWAVIVAYGFVRAWTGPWRWVVVAHPILTVVAVVLTANHYWLDVVVALLLVAGAIVACRPVGRTPPRGEILAVWTNSSP